MAALQGAKVPGADTRCLASGRSSISAFIRTARPQDTTGTFYLDLNVNNTPVTVEPIDSLQHLYDDWRVTTGGSEQTDEMPARAALEPNYPNPFNPTTTIEFQITGREYVSLKVYDVLGRETATLVSGVLEPGRHHVTLDAARISGGVYFYTLSTKAFMKTRKLLYLR
jgi:hypothetical protein